MSDSGAPLAAKRDVAALCISLAEGGDRRSVIRLLAEALGAEELLLFLRDPTLGVLLPAPQLPQTIAGGPTWRVFLRGCSAPGRRAGTVEMPKGSSRPALALVGASATAVLLGGSPIPRQVDAFAALLPLVGWGLVGEQRVMLAHAEANEAGESAGRAHALAIGLESARAELARLNGELRDEHRRKDEFLAMLAHELRNPLAPLATSIELLRHGGLEPARAALQLEVMARQTAQLARLVDDLLDVSRVSRGLVELQRQAMSLQESLRGAIDAARTVFELRGQHLEASLDAEEMWVDGDAMRLAQLFGNLLQNAAKYTDPGGRIVVSARREGSTALVEVSDSGIGIDAEMLPRVFDAFVQAPVALDRAQGGLGIGLTLVRALAELHGGRVRAESAGPGRGSTFVVELPLTREPLARPSERSVARPLADQQALRVLVVDDNRDAADTLCEMLRLMGHEVEGAPDGEEAIARVASWRPALVLLDLGLPGMDGFTVARRLRATQEGPLRLVALTGYGSEADQRRSREAGCDEHVIKPLPLELLHHILARAASAANAATERNEMATRAHAD